MPKNSHNKKVYFKVRTVTIQNTDTEELRYVSVGYEELLGTDTTHSAVTRKGLEDALNVAKQSIQLSQNEKIVYIDWNNYTAK